MGTYGEEWWLRSGGGCDPTELSEALHGAILTDLLPLSTEERYTVSGIVSNLIVNFTEILFFLFPYRIFSRRRINIESNTIRDVAASTRGSMDTRTTGYGRSRWPYNTWHVE